MADTISIVSVRTGREVSRAEVRGDTVTYSGGETARAAVRRWQAAHPGRSEADAVRTLARDGWSNGYLMIEQQPGNRTQAGPK